jgi:hypothetical protein
MRILLAIFISSFYGCSITSKVQPVPEKLTSLCLEKNDDIFMDDYLGILEKDLADLHVPSTTITTSESGKCQNVMKYKANWKWDLAMYLQYANFSVFRGEDRIGYAEYSSAAGGFRPDKWGTTEDKVKPILKELFKNQSH